MTAQLIFKTAEQLSRGCLLVHDQIIEFRLNQGPEFLVACRGALIQTSQSIQVFTFALGHFLDQAGVILLREDFPLLAQFYQSIISAIGSAERDPESLGSECSIRRCGKDLLAARLRPYNHGT